MNPEIVAEVAETQRQALAQEFDDLEVDLTAWLEKTHSMIEMEVHILNQGTIPIVSVKLICSETRITRPRITRKLA